MAFHPSDSYHSNLEPTGEDIRAGAWRLTPLADLVSERKFLRFVLRSKALPEFLPSAIRDSPY